MSFLGQTKKSFKQYSRFKTNCFSIVKTQGWILYGTTVKGSPDNTTYGTKSCITEVAHLCKYPRIKTEMKPGEKK